MKKRSDRKGMELSLNTIIIAIIAIILLVSVVSFFFFGFKGLTDRIKSIFYVTTAGYDMVLAQQTCNSYCQNAALLPEDLRKDSPYCTYPLFIDEDNNGEADREIKNDPKSPYKKFTCFPDDMDKLSVSCNVRVEDKTLDQQGVCKVN